MTQDLRSTLLYGKALGCLLGGLIGDAMGGAIAGALQGVEGIRSDWVAKAKRVSSVDQEELALKLVHAALAKHGIEMEVRSLFERTTTS